MTKEEILKFNKLCAEFLGWKKFNGLNMRYKDSYETNKVNFGEMVYFKHDLKFHSDWSWIMEVVEAIEKLKLGNVKIPVTFSSMHTITRTEIEEYYDATVVFNIIHSDCTIDIVGTMRLRNDFIEIKSLPTKKEAVVEAINQFLTWYNSK